MANEEQNSEVTDNQEVPEAEQTEQTPETQNAAEADAPDNQANKIEALAFELKKAKDNELRAYAEMDNLRRRTEKEVANAKQFALSSFAKELLDVVDNLERALGSIDHSNPDFANIDKGVELTLKTLLKVLEKNGVLQINPKGESFDPNTQHAIQMVESDQYEANTVVDVMQKGYNLNGRNIRPAMVVVSKGGSAVDTQA
ncbi:MAG: nucleotide exchange factor GrpE [Succinivibrionaceae bacterium]|nr:nucleotide exchange factor GrpE [Succinivibrionaceae bacterium]